MSLATRAFRCCSRRYRSAASSWAPRIRPSLATKLAASSRDCRTTIFSLLLSGDVVWDEAIDPTQDAAEPAAVLAAKAGATEQASRAQVRVTLFMAGLAGGGADYCT